MRPLHRRLAVTGAVVAAALAVLPAARRDEPSTRDSAERFDQVVNLLLRHHVDSLTGDALLRRAARGLVRELGDPYSELYSPKELAAFDMSTRGRYGGVGMLLEAQEGETVVSRVYPNTPAERAGVREGDHLIAVETRPTHGWPLTQVTDSLRGVEGTPVRVAFRRDGVAAPIERTLTRAVVRLPAVPYAARLTPAVGYVPLQVFSDLSADETRRAVRALLAAGARGIILDLRGNTGGLVDQSLGVANLFLPRGTDVVQVRSRASADEVLRTPAPAAVPAGVPLVLLIDGMSASASEIVAGALQDHDRALVMGTRSFGKGLVQSLYPLEGGHALKITTARWHTPLGRALHRARTHADSVAEAAGAGRPIPTVRTARGRELVADGGVTPDVLVPRDTTADPGGRIVGRAVGTRAEALARVLGELTSAYAGSVTPDGAIRDAWREDFVSRLRAGKIVLSPAAADSARGVLDRMLAVRLLRRAYGDSAVARRYYPEDRALREAVTRLERAGSMGELLTNG